MVELNKKFENKKNLDYSENFNSYIKSIYVRNILNVRPTVTGNGILHAKPTERSHIKDTKEFKILPVSYVIPGTDILTKIELKVLENINDYDICKWLDEFDHVARKMNWDDNTQFCVIQEVLSSNIVENLKYYNTINDLRKQLINIKYPPHKTAFYTNKLQKIEQIDIYLISYYYNDIELTVKKLDLCQSLAKKERERLLRDNFFLNLHSKVKIKMSEMNLFNTSEILQCI
ncbi:hypothetical protein DMUE_1915 [Dictyocoela muelleri]|nr:hypothetical protein DMUE_1915 [Dictyocoela muelleri]